mmetsp:Transcript_471/g.1102  ORF Transcript_471/g.1102 Transcript_471/m.1102 type:complete len:734 (-) Transcript_471:308-2509(-)|eukprot:CAMPEP_0206436568 /NCGR_PEP_ID=MMETSP0324_2-20121206/10554_1 /ASSEMBLY_ACC=CAM_ASM_000836 /TAXON_ID=2866 /ORGANISM="Crypthecodinium cohnii, Strain Seligo" /LENGTH=733 /DNA_ID=CAMNT_0053903745 /DNA_START=240 /DNA_END=2441 /DNA_ORIENTATION=-
MAADSVQRKIVDQLSAISKKPPAPEVTDPILIDLEDDEPGKPVAMETKDIADDAALHEVVSEKQAAANAVGAVTTEATSPITKPAPPPEGQISADSPAAVAVVTGSPQNSETPESVSSSGAMQEESPQKEASLAEAATSEKPDIASPPHSPTAAAAASAPNDTPSPEIQPVQSSSPKKPADQASSSGMVQDDPAQSTSAETNVIVGAPPPSPATSHTPPLLPATTTCAAPAVDIIDLSMSPRSPPGTSTEPSLDSKKKKQSAALTTATAPAPTVGQPAKRKLSASAASTPKAPPAKAARVEVVDVEADEKRRRIAACRNARKEQARKAAESQGQESWSGYGYEGHGYGYDDWGGYYDEWAEWRSTWNKPGPKKAKAKGVVKDQNEQKKKKKPQTPTSVLIDTGRRRKAKTSSSIASLKTMLYISSKMRWGPGPPLNERRGSCSGVRLDDDRMWIVGGSATKADGNTEVLNFKAEGPRMTFSDGPKLSRHRRECACIALDEDRVMVIGGFNGANFLSSTEILNIRTMQTVPGPKIVQPRASPGVGYISSSNRIVVVGGKNSYGCLSSIEYLDLSCSQPQFKLGPSLKVGRSGPSVLRLDDRRLFVLGGHDYERTHICTEILEFVESASGVPRLGITAGPDLGATRSYCATVQLDPEHMFLIGGHDGYKYLDTTDVLNVKTMLVTRGPPMRQKRFMCCAAKVKEDRIMVLGGSVGSQDHQSTELLNLPSFTFVVK